MCLDHVAHPSRSPRATDRFYSQVLGLTLVQAYAGEELLFVYALPDGGSLAFSATLDGNQQPDNDDDWQRRHVGLTVATRADFEEWVRRLKEFGVRYELVDDERVYFADPDGLVLELEVASRMGVDPSAPEIFERWLAV